MTYLIDFIEIEEILMKFRTQFDGKSDERSARHVTIPIGDSRTKQAFKDESDINNILKRYNVTGILPDQSRQALAHFGDFTNVPSYDQALQTVIDSQDAFMQLPATLRQRFANDPQHLLNFLSDSSNRDEAIKLGFINPPQQAVPAPVEPQGATSTKSKGKPTPKETESPSDE